MPFTPFHFGPGVLVKSVFPKYFSFTLFALTQVLIDMEILSYMVQDEYPWHRFFHSYIGAIVMIIIIVLIGRTICNIGMKLMRLSRTISFKCAIITGILATSSHVFFDSIMHSDMKPFAPISETNPMLHVMNVGMLHLLCGVCGMVGIAVLAIRYMNYKKAE